LSSSQNQEVNDLKNKLIEKEQEHERLIIKKRQMEEESEKKMRETIEIMNSEFQRNMIEIQTKFEIEISMMKGVIDRRRREE